MVKEESKERNERTSSYFPFSLALSWDTHFPCIGGRGGGREFGSCSSSGVLLLLLLRNGFIMRHLRSFRAHDPDTRSSVVQRGGHSFFLISPLSLPPLRPFVHSLARRDTRPDPSILSECPLWKLPVRRAFLCRARSGATFGT